MNRIKASPLLAGATWISPDEPCFLLVEVVLKTPDEHDYHRYQLVYVVRDDSLAEYRADLGPAWGFANDQFRIPGGSVNDDGRIEIVHTVGELQDIAEELRFGPAPQGEPRPVRDLIGDWHRQLEETDLIRKHRTTIGPGGWVQRS